MSFSRSLRRVRFYAKGVIRDLIPASIYGPRLDRLFSSIETAEHPEIVRERLGYYNKIESIHTLLSASEIRHITRKPSYCYYDFKEFANYFEDDLRVAYDFGDVTYVPTEPSIVKSRPIGAANANSVLMKLDKLRHFTWPTDRVPFREKRKSAVWRGILGDNPLRRVLVEQFARHPVHDIGHTCEAGGALSPKPYLDIRGQLQHRYVLSIEGNDVATNLKWIMASQSLCMMPRPRYETWFMEGRLVPGVHYVEVRRDFADLEDKIAYYDRNEDEARAIIANANRHVAQFGDRQTEDLISVLVLQKYFERTGQRAPEAFSTALFG
jgi:hypothetical protein